jgi:hypothetical protein
MFDILIDLPYELVDMIASYLNTKSLILLAKLCRQILFLLKERLDKEVQTHRLMLGKVLKEWNETISYIKLNKWLDKIREERRDIGEETDDEPDWYDEIYETGPNLKKITFEVSYWYHPFRLVIHTHKSFKLENDMWYGKFSENPHERVPYFSRLGISNYRMNVCTNSVGYECYTTIYMREYMYKGSVKNKRLPLHFDEYVPVKNKYIIPEHTLSLQDNLCYMLEIPYYYYE